MQFSSGHSFDRREFLKLAGVSWLTPVGRLLAEEAERAPAGAVDHPLVARRGAIAARNF